MVEKDVGQSSWQSAEFNTFVQPAFLDPALLASGTLFQCGTPHPMTQNPASVTWEPSHCVPLVWQFGDGLLSLAGGLSEPYSANFD